jgi:endonuclease/exonuclease/phosphatase family metal-dependent hydrolase
MTRSSRLFWLSNEVHIWRSFYCFTMTHYSLTLGLVFAAITATLASAEEGQADVRVMTFNIRYGTAEDGENHWNRRKEFLAETIRAFDPDLLGTQETLKFQRDFLAEKLPEHDWVGVGRDDGRDNGEMMAIYYRRDRFNKLDEGHFWLSDTPDEIGSKSWDSSLPRMVTWVLLADQRQADAPPILFANTHFDHLGPKARLESAKLLRRRLAVMAEGAAVILTGDFNAGETSPPYRALFAASENELSLTDCFRASHPTATENEGTFSGFDAANAGGARIDWIACSEEWKVQSCEIDRTSKDGRTPSDHLPVTATLLIR